MNTTVAEKKPIKITGVKALTKLDRCDACGPASRAYARATKGKLELLFCRHHMQKLSPSLIGQGWDIDDQTHILDKEVDLYKKVSADDDKF